MPEQLPIAGPMLGAALTVVGLLISWIVWRRRGAAAGLRGVAWSLLPVAAGLMGLMTILWRFVGDLVGFFASLIFDPVVWAGVAVAALAVVLWVVSGAMRSRGVGTSGRKSRKQATSKDTAPSAGAGENDSAKVEAPQQKKGASGGGDEDFSEIEDLLRKHGIE